MLSTAFNALIRLHSRPAILKRLGTINHYSPMRISPSNYFRFLNGPEYTTVTGKEFIIPVSSITGHYANKFVFSDVPTLGQFKIQYGMTATDFLDYDATAAEIQTALRLLAGLENVVVTGNFADNFIVTFEGFSVSPGLGQVVSSTLDETATVSNTYTLWGDILKKGDRIVDGNKTLSIDEIIEMPDIGGTVMGYRVRCD